MTGPVWAATGAMDRAVISVVVGLFGVFLARTVFVDRENRRLQRKQSWRETWPVTGVAMLIAGVWIWDAKPSLSMAAFTGLGVGWVAVLLLDILGKRVTDGLRALLGITPDDTSLPKTVAPAAPLTPAQRDIPPDMAALVDAIDEADKKGTHA